MPIKHGLVSWPGVEQIESFSYTVSHGTAPGVATIHMIPQAASIAGAGDLKFTDGDVTITLRDCKLERMVLEDTGGAGRYVVLTILDRRWRWQFGDIDGCYNQLDPRARLRPWTIRSPTEMIEAILLAMKEPDYSLFAPDGLTRADGRAFPPPRFVARPGTNPPIDWHGMVPAQALAQLCDFFNLRIIFQPINNRIRIEEMGGGIPLPEDDTVSIHRLLPGIKIPQAPDSVGVVGDPTRFQMRFKVISVGLEYDGTYRPIQDLTYAPARTPARPQKDLISVQYDGVSTVTFDIFITNVDGQPIEQGALISVTVTGGTTQDAIADAISAAIAASDDPRIKGVVTATWNGDNTITIQGPADGSSYVILARISTPDVPVGNYLTSVLLQTPRVSTSGWWTCDPKHFSTVRATPQLTKSEAQKLAQRSVYRCFRLSPIGLQGRGNNFVPGYGEVDDIRRIVLTDTQCEQVTPQPGDENLFVVPQGGTGRLDRQGRGGNVEPFIQDFYDQYSRDKPIAVYGSIYRAILEGNTGIHLPAWADVVNTDPKARLPFSFSTDPNWQLVTCETQLYMIDQSGRYLAPDLTVQTGVCVRDANTNALVHFREVRPLPGSTTTDWPVIKVCPDIQLNWVSEYEDVNENPFQAIFGNGIKRVYPLENDPFQRANYYLGRMMLAYQPRDSRIIEYNGLVSIDPDSSIHQVTWTIDSSGVYTIAGRNTEYSVWIPQYRARERATYLDAVQRTIPAQMRINDAINAIELFQGRNLIPFG